MEKNETAVLDGEVAVERVIVQEEVRLYRVSKTVARLDSDIYDFEDAKTVFLETPLPVYNSVGDRIGFASIHVDTGCYGHRRIDADISIEYETEERLLSETQSLKIYPVLRGWMSFIDSSPLAWADGFLDFQAKKKKVGTVYVSGLFLTSERPSDKRITPLSQPGM